MNWLTFEKVPQLDQRRKTCVWNVVSKTGVYVGKVKWHGAWRQFAFFPEEGTLFERGCLRSIADFCEVETIMQLGKAPRLTLKQKTEGS